MTADLTVLVALMPFAADLGIELEEASADRVIAALPWAARLCTGGGILHGGVLMTLADSAGDGRTAVTVQIALRDCADKLVAQTTQIQAIRGE